MCMTIFLENVPQSSVGEKIMFLHDNAKLHSRWEKYWIQTVLFGHISIGLHQMISIFFILNKMLRRRKKILNTIK